MGSRRELLKLAPSLAGLAGCARVANTAAGRPRRADYGPLRPAGPELALPEGFRYVRFGETGTPLSDGTPTPGRHDGMACFATRRRDLVRLVRNHELLGPRNDLSAWRAAGDPAHAYDPIAPGGTTTLELRLRRGRAPELRRSWLSVTGTANNCAGGPTPWGSWLTCEETVLGTGDGLPRNHGYVFEVPSEADSPVEAVPLKAMGRFVHEAVAVDPSTHFVYLTEDQIASGFYRFIPDARARGPLRAGMLREGGRLQMLALRDERSADTRRGQQPGSVRPVRWVDIPDPDPADVTGNSLFMQGYAQGGATFARLEGAWWGDGGVYFHATSGGDEGLGQVWLYRPAAEGGELILVFESRSRDVLAGPDNITMSPRGGLVLCEDGRGGQRLHGLSPRGEIFPFALNIFNEREFAGACFSPDGSVLFVNIQGGAGGEADPLNLGMTLAVWGPWERGAL